MLSANNGESGLVPQMLESFGHPFDLVEVSLALMRLKAALWTVTWTNSGQPLEPRDSPFVIAFQSAWTSFEYYSLTSFALGR